MPARQPIDPNDTYLLLFCPASSALPWPCPRCSDVNECEMSMAVCGEALCENHDGSFLCICPSDNEEFDPVTSQCRSLGNTAAQGGTHVRIHTMTPVAGRTGVVSALMSHHLLSKQQLGEEDARHSSSGGECYHLYLGQDHVGVGALRGATPANMH